MIEQPSCLPCLTGYPEECWVPDEYGDSSCIIGEEDSIFTGLISTPKPVTEKKAIGRPVKDFKDVKDLESTGRKYAARMYPLKDGMTCEWAELASAGGGAFPIIGCDGNTASHRHHGPDKNTLNNEIDNVHRICATCHNRWHAANDRYYPTERPAGDVPYLPLEGIECKLHDRVTKKETNNVG